MRAMTAADGFGFVRLHHVQLAIPSGGEAVGVEVVWDDGFPGFRRFPAVDPHGNRLEFLEPVG